MLKTPRAIDIRQPLPDPFCLTRPEGYYLTGSGPEHPGKNRLVFDMFFSEDLIEWRKLGKILELPNYNGSSEGNFWAPEIVSFDSKYYLYYTADAFGNPEQRYVRVAVSDQIKGPYLDSGVRLTEQPSIDGHAFFISSSEGYLFYTGNEGNDHCGQLMMDRFASPLRLENRPQRVFPNEKVEWEEGPFVFRQSDRFLLFTSQGNWRNETYHVTVAVSDRIEGPYHRCQKGNANWRLLESAEETIGPGHCSVFIDHDSNPNICFHAWDRKMTGRYPWMAQLEWDKGYFNSMIP